MDFSPTEYKEIYLSTKVPTNSNNAKQYSKTSETPNSVDWRKRGVINAVRD
jgi:hypothetical protein